MGAPCSLGTTDKTVIWVTARPSSGATARPSSGVRQKTVISGDSKTVIWATASGPSGGVQDRHLGDSKTVIWGDSKTVIWATARLWGDSETVIWGDSDTVIWGDSSGGTNYGRPTMNNATMRKLVSWKEEYSCRS